MANNNHVFKGLTKEHAETIMQVVSENGLRFSEMIMLKLPDINFKDGTIKAPGMGGKCRNVALSKNCADLLKTLVDQNPIS